MTEIKLGDKVKDRITGFVGTVVCKSEFLNGCIQFEVQPKITGKDNKIVEAVSIDAQSLEVINVKKKKPVKKESNGGAMTKGLRQRGY